MLMCSQLKLSERRSIRKLMNCNTGGDSIVVRPCTQRNITEVSQRVSNIHHVVTEKRLPELRVVSLNLEDQPTTNNDKKITRTPYRMPLFCTHFKSAYKKNYQRDKKDLDENFIVRGFEVGSGTPSVTSLNTVNTDNNYDPDDDDLNFLRNGIQIQLTDCCQCVCDLFNSSFPISQDSHDMSYVTIETCNSLRPFRPKDLVSPVSPVIETQSNSLLDPNILKVIRVTMNTKNLTDCK